MRYVTELSHFVFVLLLDVLRKAKEQNVVSWSVTDMICQATRVVYEPEKDGLQDDVDKKE